ncbi:MAG: CaiB/BaiF CoA-transferase family protein, partial [Acidimicrobiales bacterium]
MFFSTLLKSLDMKVGEVSDPGLSSNGKPLDGVRILAVEQMQSLPFATQLLARLGADVVKVEHPVRGDLGRGSQPSVPDSNGESVGATFLRNNLNKRSIGLNLKDPAAQDIFLALAPKFDVVAENFRPGAMVSFGLGYDQVAAASPEVIYLSVSGFGNSGDSPYTHWPAFAPVAEAMSGMYNVNRAADEPIKVSPAGALGDTGTGLFAAVGILAALRHRDRTGIGQHIDISMFDSMVSFADLVPNYLSL